MSRVERSRWTMIGVAALVVLVGLATVLIRGSGGDGPRVGGQTAAAIETPSEQAPAESSAPGTDAADEPERSTASDAADTAGAGDEHLNPVFDAASFLVAEIDPLDPDPLPVPERPPADPYADVDVPEIGTVDIPAIGLNDHKVVEGITLTAINEGPGHWPGSALPGQRGNAVFPGHRTTYSHPFYDIDALVPGDEMTFTMADGTHTYAVTESLIVSPEDLWVVDQTENSTATIIACHPRGSARQRIVVKFELVSSVASEGAGRAAGVLAGLSEQLPI